MFNLMPYFISLHEYTLPLADIYPLEKQWGQLLQSTYHPFLSGPFHFQCYPNHCISHRILQSMDRQKYFPFEFSECDFFSPSWKHDSNRNRNKKSYFSSTSFCTQSKVNYMEASILGSTAWTWGFSLCPFITFCWLASPSCNIPTILTGKMLTHAWLACTPEGKMQSVLLELRVASLLL